MAFNIFYITMLVLSYFSGACFIWTMILTPFFIGVKVFAYYKKKGTQKPYIGKLKDYSISIDSVYKIGKQYKSVRRDLY